MSESNDASEKDELGFKDRLIYFGFMSFVATLICSPFIFEIAQHETKLEEPIIIWGHTKNILSFLYIFTFALLASSVGLITNKKKAMIYIGIIITFFFLVIFKFGSTFENKINNAYFQGTGYQICHRYTETKALVDTYILTHSEKACRMVKELNIGKRLKKNKRDKLQRISRDLKERL